MSRCSANIFTRAIILIPTCSSAPRARCACPIFFYGSSLTRRCISRPNCGRISQRKTFLPQWKNLDAGNAATAWWNNLEPLRCAKRNLNLAKQTRGASPTRRRLHKRFRYGIRERFAFLREDEVAVQLSKQAEANEFFDCLLPIIKQSSRTSLACSQ